MANARKLPSGAYQTRVTKSINGKKVTKAFTVSPKECKGDSRKAKALSEMMAREWQISAENTLIYGQTVKTALENYINDRSKVLSPSTLTNYKRILPYFEPLFDIYVDDIKSSDIQPLINEWGLTLRTKTIINRISFLLSALDYADCDKKFKLRYPKNESKKVLAPDLEDVKMMIDAAGDDFKPVIYLAAFYGLRRGEIAALKEKDLSRDMCLLNVHADIVLDDNKWIYKPFPKNALSGTLKLSKTVVGLLPLADDPEAFVFNINPNIITHRFDKLKKKLGFDFSFHSLRHFAASFRSDLGIPRKYIEEVGRWESGSSVLDRVYDNTLDSSRKKYTQMANTYIEDNFFKAKQA